MKFGSVDNPGDIDFTLPPDHPATKKVLSKSRKALQRINVGCAKWNKTDLKGFYPRGTKDELEYYSRQFNSIELNATFYNLYSEEQVAKWAGKTPDNFRFFPKLPQYVSHMKRLKDYQDYLNDYLVGINAFGDKLGMLFLQMHDNFGPKEENVKRLKDFILDFPNDLRLAVELRHKDWFMGDIFDEVCQFFEDHNICNILVDTAGRRDIMHMRMTTPSAFVRYVGANHQSDYDRLDEWVGRIKTWKDQGLEVLDFFIHQNLEKESPLLATHFIKKLNSELGTNLEIPNAHQNGQTGLGI
ncbi:DUF72 domain-containing protein [Fulvivirga sp.]|uniref:DUF72 domain-containing protein n=1 Tax=Fulvivirga sp. TaxID=1931237 RepID=UPI0032EAD471